MSVDTIVAVLAATILFIGPVVVLGLAALRFGADSRPGIGDDQRPGLVPGA